MTNNIFDRIGGVEEASAKWGISPVTIKQMCQASKINAKKIGNSWAVDLEQQNPALANKNGLKIKGIKNAVSEFNNWVGAARIYFDKENLEVWTSVFGSENSWDDYKSDSIVQVHAKILMQDNWDTITMAQLKNICENHIKNL